MSPLEALRDLLGPGLVFLALSLWLVRKAWKATRTERELKVEREQPGPADPLHLVSPAADAPDAHAEHVALVHGLASGDVLWIRSLGAHVAWLERGAAGERVLRVLRLDQGAVAERWEFR